MRLSALRLAPRALAVLGLALAAPRAGAQAAIPQLEPLAWLVGAPWVGTVGEGAEAAEDVSVWSWAVGGHALRNVHAVAGGAYGGETLLWWDPAAEAFAFVYVTTGGFTTRGHLTLGADGALEGVEEVGGGSGTMADGIEAVRSVSRPGPGGTLVVEAAYRRAGAWGPAESRTYARSADAALPCALDPACRD